MRKELENEEKILEELDINTASLFSLEKELKESSRKEAKYIRWASQASRKVNDLTLELDVLSAQVVDEICRQENITNSNRAEVRKTKINTDKRIIKKRNELNNALEEKEYLDKLVKTWVSRGFNVRGLVELGEKIMITEPLGQSYYSKKKRNEEKQLDEIMEID
jgi:hypothetical protein